MRFKLVLIFLTIKLFNIHICDQTERSWQPDYFKSSERQYKQKRDTELISEQDDPLLIFSTLDGSLIGIKQRSGNILWRQNDEPIVKVPVELGRTSMPMFLPDPKDGSLYVFGTETEALKKLPFTIPQLVANSPCRSSDGILYTGRKIDTWFGIDPRTGQREQLLGFDKVKNTCPVEMQNAVFMGRTEYSIIMVDSKQKNRKWNVTFYDYSATKMEPEGIENYDLVHFATSSTGRIVTVDRKLGIILWELDVQSPVIAVYIVREDGLLTVPFTSVADETLNLILKRFANKPSDIQLFPTLYIGQHRHGLYALPSLVDLTTATISNNIGQLLLEGPLSVPQLGKNDNGNVPLSDTYNNEYQAVITLGHYEIQLNINYKNHNHFKLPVDPIL